MSTRPDDESPDSTSDEPSSKSTGSSPQGKPDNRTGLFSLGRMGGGGPRPPRKPRSRTGGGRPGPLALTISIIAAIAVAIGILSQVWTEVLWFSQIGYARVLWTQWIALIVLFLVGFAVMFGAVFVSMTTAYRAREIGMPDDEATRNLEAYRSVIEPVRRRLTWVVPAVLALFGSAWELAPSWREILLALNSESFGVKDPQFGIDISFYVFILPAVLTLVSFLSGVILFSGVASIVVHYLYGGISVVRRPHFTKAARMHLAVFLALYAVIRAVGYWLGRYSALYASSSKIDKFDFDGANYTDVNAVIPANAILAAIGLAVAILFIASVRSSSWRLPIIGVVVMIVSSLVVGTAYPLVIQKFIVDPNAQRQEAEYIQRHINATKAAYGLENVETTNYDATTKTAAGQLEKDAESTTSIRLLDPGLISPTFQQVQQNKQYYSFANRLNVDRYKVDSTSRDTVIAVRELNLSGLGEQQQTWVNEHTVYTHGYGVVNAYGNTVATRGYPSFWEGGIPSQGDLGKYEPRIYFGQSSPSYSIVGGKDNGSPRELDYPDDESKTGQVNTTFAGNGGPSVSNPFNRLLYAAKFREANILFSQEVREGSQILYDRDPAKRVAKVAPWLTLDNSPYPAVVDHDDNPATPKRVMWIVDGYTTTNNYPYAQHESLAKATATADNKGGLLRAPEESNYVRNSVKAVVDAYDGSVKLYQWDDKDPILKAWQKVFPGTVSPMSEMSADLIAHMRYPEDLFNVQRTMTATYHVNDAAEFYSGGDFWKIPDDPTTPRQDQQAPYYLTLKMPGQGKASFSLSSAYIIGGNTNRNVLTGFLAVDSETSPGTGRKGERSATYGKLRLLALPRSSNVAGPGQVQNIFDSNPAISKELNLLSQEGSQVIKGNLLTLPVGGGLLYVQPVYVQSSSGTQYPLLRKVLVSFGDNVGFADTLSGALDQVFGGNSGATTGQETIDGDAAAANDTNETTDGKDPTADGGAQASPTPSAAPTPSASAPPTASATPQASGSSDPKAELNQALSDAQTAMADADNARSKGDWTAYGDAQKRLNDAVKRAVEAQQKLG